MIHPRYRGVELPEFSGDAPLLHHFTIEHGIKLTEEATVIRLCHMSLPRDAFDNLGTVLSTAEEEFTILENGGEVDIVSHQWGLYPLEAALDQDGRYAAYLNPTDIQSRLCQGYNLLPPGFLLAAQVSIIDAVPPPEDYSVEDRLKMRLRRYRAGLDGPIRPFKLNDIDITQCVHGTPKAIPSDPANYKLVDIEPRLKLLAA